MCAVRAVCVGILSKEKKMQRGQWAYCMFFSCITAMLEKRKQKQGGKEIIWEAVRKMEKNTVTIIVAFLSGLSLLDLSIALRHLKKIYLENFWWQSLIWYLAKPYFEECSVLWASPQGRRCFSHPNSFSVAMRSRILRNMELLIVDIV